VQLFKSITAGEIFQHKPSVKKELWGGDLLWNMQVEKTRPPSGVFSDKINMERITYHYSEIFL